MDGAAGVEEEEEDDELLESDFEEALSLLFDSLVDSLFDSFESLFDVDAVLSPAGCFPFCE